MQVKNCLYNALLQLVCMLLLFIIPIIWWEMSGISSIDGLPISYLLLSVGSMLCLEGFCYLALPIDLIPDSIPLIGYADDSLAWIVIVIGGWCLLLGMIMYLGPYLLMDMFG